MEAGGRSGGGEASAVTRLPMNEVVAPDPLASFRLDGRVVLLTGASSGIGHRFAQVLHAAGAQVVVAARRLDRLEELVARLPGSVAVATDVSKDADCARLVDVSMERFGRIDVLVNNAGTTATFAPESEPMDEWRNVMAVNVNGAFHLAQLCASSWMLANGGNIINVASVLGTVSSGRLPQASYAASKGALVNLTRELACLWARRGVRVNALCPGWFRSELTEEITSNDAGMKYLRQRTPMGRLGAAHELDGALLFLGSDASSFMTGQTLLIDGGWAAQ